MKSIFTIAVGFCLFMAVCMTGAEQTWTGEISDGSCRAEHVPISEGDPVLPSPECVKLCHRAGWKYVFVTGEKVYAIANQDAPGLEKFAGQPVKLTGEMKGESVTVSRIEAASTVQAKRFAVRENLDILFADAPVKPAGKTVPLHLDLYEPDDDGVALRAAIIVVHGGGFTRGDKRSVNAVQLCRDLTARGMVCTSIDYRLEGDQPDVAGPTPRHQAILGSMQDASVAYEWMLNNANRFRVDQNRIAMAGMSAGATSVLLAGYANPAELPLVRAVVSMWGGMGGPVTLIAKGKPALLIVHGTVDREVPFSEAQRMSKQAEKEGVPYKLIAVPGAGHGVNLATEYEGKPIFDHIAEFLSVHVR